MPHACQEQLGLLPSPRPWNSEAENFSGVVPCSSLGRCTRAVNRQGLGERPKLNVCVIILHNRVIF